MMTPDPTMTAITDAVTRGRAGDGDGARTALTDLWTSIGPHGDPFHRCTLAHYLADLHDDPAQALTWDIRALDAAESLTNSRAQEFDPSLDVRGFFPSLHLNLADNYRRLASFDAAQQQVHAARRHLHALPDDAYGAMIRTALDEVEASVISGTTSRRASAPTGRPQMPRRPRVRPPRLPELAPIWCPRPTPFDAEDAPALVATPSTATKRGRW